MAEQKSAALDMMQMLKREEAIIERMSDEEWARERVTITELVDMRNRAMIAVIAGYEAQLGILDE